MRVKLPPPTRRLLDDEQREREVSSETEGRKTTVSSVRNNGRETRVERQQLPSSPNDQIWFCIKKRLLKTICTSCDLTRKQEEKNNEE